MRALVANGFRGLLGFWRVGAFGLGGYSLGFILIGGGFGFVGWQWFGCVGSGLLVGASCTHLGGFCGLSWWAGDLRAVCLWYELAFGRFRLVVVWHMFWVWLVVVYVLALL